MKGDLRNPDAREMVQEWNRGVILWLVSPDKEKRIAVSYRKYQDPRKLMEFLEAKIAEEKIPKRS